MEQKLSIGRIVHVILESSGEYKHFPAICVYVKEDTVGGFQVFSPDIWNSVYIDEFPYAENGKFNTWHWPERE